MAGPAGIAGFRRSNHRFKRTIQAVDAHAGIPMRVITGGVPHIPGKTVYDKMKWLEAAGVSFRRD